MGKNAQKRRHARKHASPASRKPGGEKRPVWIPVELPRTADKHWFAPRTRHLLDSRTVEKLGLIAVALYACRVGPQVGTETNIALPLLELKVHYRYLPSSTLAILESCGIPARTTMPLKFSYPDVLLPVLPDRVNKELFFNNLIDVLYCYWSVLRGVAYLQESGLARKAAESRSTSDAFAEFIERTQGVPRDKVKAEAKGGLSPPMMEAKWLADATIIKIRALWDKCLGWLSRDYYGVRLNKDQWGDRTHGRLGELASKVLGKMDDTPERALLDDFLSICCELDGLRQYRDSDLHKVSPRITEVLGRADKDTDMLGLLHMVNAEALRSNEGLMISFSIMLAAGGKIP